MTDNGTIRRASALLLAALFVAAAALAATRGAEAATDTTTTTTISSTITSAKVYVDGQLEETIKGDGSYRQEVDPGCHKVRVVSTTRSGGSISKHSFCLDTESTITVTVSGGELTLSSTSADDTSDSSTTQENTSGSSTGQENTSGSSTGS